MIKHCMTALLLTYGSFVFASNSNAQKHDAKQERIYPKVVGAGIYPQWSPTGLHLAFIDGSQLNVYSVETGLVNSVSSVERNDFCWSGESELTVLLERDYVDARKRGAPRALTYSLDGRLIRERSYPSKGIPRGTLKIKRSQRGNASLQDTRLIQEPRFVRLRDLPSERSSTESDELFLISTRYFIFPEYVNQPRPSGSTEIWLVNTRGEPVQLIAKSKPVHHYRAPTFSSDGSLVLFSDGVGTRVFTARGDSVGIVSPASAASWIPASTRFVFARIVDDGENLVESDLYVSESSGANIIQITDTDSKIEVYPMVSYDKNLLAYTDYTTGQIEIVALQTKE